MPITSVLDCRLDDVGDKEDYDGDGGDAREAGIDTQNNQLKAEAEAAAAEILVAMATARRQRQW